MPTHTRLWRTTALMVPLMGILLLLLLAVVLYLEQSALGSAAVVILAIIVAIGLLPGSFLQSLLDRGAAMASRANPTLIVAASLAFPGLLVILSAVGAIIEWRSLQFALEFGLEATRQVALISFLGGFAALGILFLVANLVIVTRMNDSRNRMTS